MTPHLWIIENFGEILKMGAQVHCEQNQLFYSAERFIYIYSQQIIVTFCGSNVNLVWTANLAEMTIPLGWP